jgi:hypothetical protein
MSLGIAKDTGPNPHLYVTRVVEVRPYSLGSQERFLRGARRQISQSGKRCGRSAVNRDEPQPLGQRSQMLTLALAARSLAIPSSPDTLGAVKRL